jgi:hypothetical protein
MPPPVLPLPESFTSLYRLFLRAASASVLHHPPAVRNVRSLWRPAFEDGVRAIRYIERVGNDGQVDATLDWYKEWTTRSTSSLTLQP